MTKAIHSMIRVLDLERSITFYRQALGLEVADRLELGDFTLVYLGNEESDFELELTCNHGRTEPYSHGSGYGHLAVSVPDAGITRQALLELGLQPLELKEFSRDGQLLSRFFFLSDPDGYQIEFLQRCGRFR